MSGREVRECLACKRIDGGGGGGGSRGEAPTLTIALIGDHCQVLESACDLGRRGDASVDDE